MTVLGLVAVDEEVAGRIRTILAAAGMSLAFDTTPTALERARDVVGLPVVVAGPLRDRGGSALSRSRERLPGARLFACAPEGDPRALRWALDNGAEGIIWDTELEHTLELGLRALLAGLLVVPQDLRRRLQPPQLTTREKHVLSMVIMGLSNGEIASKLYLTESTVKSHLGTAFRKLGVRSRAEAARLITDPEEGLGMGILAITEARLSRPGADRS